MTSKRKMELLTAVLATAGMLCAQETRKAVTNPSPDLKDDTSQIAARSRMRMR